jgi:hypothetical protein
MRLKLLVLGVAMALLSQPLQAGWVASGSSNLVGAFEGSVVNYAVFDTEGGTNFSGLEPLNLSAGTSGYVYLYQATESGTVGMRTVAFDNVAGVTTGGQLDNYRLNGTSLTASGATKNSLSTDLSLLPDSVTFNFAAGNPNRPSPVLYFVSENAPGLGDILIGLEVPGKCFAAGQVPVPIPVPPALALIGLGLPFVGMLKKRMSR